MARLQINIDMELKKRLKIHLINTTGRVSDQSRWVTAAIVEKLAREEDKE